MNHDLIIQKLLAVPKPEWDRIIRICYSHLKLKLGAKMKYGAHSQSRLGLCPYDFYFGEAVTALYKGRWEWKYEEYSLLDQIIRIMDSMISEQVRKFEIERDQGRPNLIASTNEQLSILTETQDEENDDDHYDKCTQALLAACENDHKYLRFVELKKKGASYDEISSELKCTKKEAYQLLNTISKRANKILITL